MQEYKKVKLKSYKKVFKEDFFVKDINKVVKLSSSVIGKRLGVTIKTSAIAGSFERDGIKYTGIRGLMSDGRAIRFNWKFGGDSARIISIDVWNQPSAYPDITIETDGYNIVQIINTIVEAIEAGVPDVYTFVESKIQEKKGFSPKTRDSVNAWIRKLVWDNDNDTIDTDKLENTKFVNLFKDYEFWHKEYGKEEGYDKVTKYPFDNFLKSRMADLGLENVFSHKVKVGKSGKESILVDNKVAKDFDASIYEMTLNDLMRQINGAVQFVTKGFKTATLITGTAGIGKTRQVTIALKEQGFSEASDKWSARGTSGKKYKIISGDIKNPRALYQLLYDWNDPNLILVFDDVNSILKNKSNVELLRRATTNDKVREIYYSDNKINDTSRKYKPFLEFESRIIIITNLPKKKIDSAIVSRTAPVEIVATFDQIADNIRIELEEIEPKGFMDEKLEVFQFLVYEARSMVAQLDFRIFMDALQWRLIDDPYWKKYVLQMVRKN